MEGGALFGPVLSFPVVVVRIWGVPAAAKISAESIKPFSLGSTRRSSGAGQSNLTPKRESGEDLCSKRPGKRDGLSFSCCGLFVTNGGSDGGHYERRVRRTKEGHRRSKRAPWPRSARAWRAWGSPPRSARPSRTVVSGRATTVRSPPRACDSRPRWRSLLDAPFAPRASGSARPPPSPSSPTTSPSRTSPRPRTRARACPSASSARRAISPRKKCSPPSSRSTTIATSPRISGCSATRGAR